MSSKGDGQFRWYWAKDFDQESGYYGGFPTRQQAIDDAMLKTPVGEEFVILEADKQVPNFNIFNARSLLEAFEEDNIELWSEDGSGLPPEDDYDAAKSLEAHLTEALQQWVAALPDPLAVWLFATERNKERHTVSAPPSRDFIDRAHAL